ncbi:hypothetical protein SEA_SHAOBING_82 [Mycobacterium phage Shaobing]|nr:hypothetical protein SEA_SHAOBING_82 [Mycobacterium phage Shaobing]
MNVAEQYPAVTDASGRTWYRPVRPAGADFSQWGWTSDPAQAHPDYQTDLAAMVRDREAPVVAAAAATAERYRGAFEQVLRLAEAAAEPPVREQGDQAALFDAAAYGVAYVAVRPS